MVYFFAVLWLVNGADVVEGAIFTNDDDDMFDGRLRGGFVLLCAHGAQESFLDTVSRHRLSW
jgi:hypothetical protein